MPRRIAKSLRRPRTNRQEELPVVRKGWPALWKEDEHDFGEWQYHLAETGALPPGAYESICGETSPLAVRRTPDYRMDIVDKIKRAAKNKKEKWRQIQAKAKTANEEGGICQTAKTE